MRTTLTLDDDVALLLTRLRKSRNAGLKELVNEAFCASGCASSRRRPRIGHRIARLRCRWGPASWGGSTTWRACSRWPKANPSGDPCGRQPARIRARLVFRGARGGAGVVGRAAERHRAGGSAVAQPRGVPAARDEPARVHAAAARGGGVAPSAGVARVPRRCGSRCPRSVIARCWAS